VVGVAGADLLGRLGVGAQAHALVVGQPQRLRQEADQAVGVGDVLLGADLESHRDELRAVDLDLASFVCVTSIEALTHTAVIHQSEFLSDMAVETLIDEATRLVLRYLR
jgi:hypothetical protein